VSSAASDARATTAKARRIVVKIGSSTLTQNGELASRMFGNIARQVSALADAGREVVYRIVGADEFDPAKGWISIDAPLARALLAKSLDDEVQVATPGGEVSFVVVAIDYTE